MFRKTRAIAMAALVTTLAFVAIACDDDDSGESSDTASQGAVDTVTARVQRNEMMFAVISFRSLGLHGMDEAINEERTIDSQFAPNTRTAIRLLALTDWAPEFKDDAETVRGHAVDLLAALEDEDIDAAGTAATALHEGEHDLSTAVWNEIAKDLPPDAGGPEEEHEAEETPDGGTTPASGATPAAGGTPAAAATPASGATPVATP